MISSSCVPKTCPALIIGMISFFHTVIAVISLMSAFLADSSSSVFFFEIESATTTTGGELVVETEAAEVVVFGVGDPVKAANCDFHRSSSDDGGGLFCAIAADSNSRE